MKEIYVLQVKTLEGEERTIWLMVHEDKACYVVEEPPRT